MVLQSRRVWLAGQFVPAQLETADGKIVNVYPFGTKTADVDYGNKRIVPGFMDSIPMTASRKVCATG